MAVKGDGKNSAQRVVYLPVKALLDEMESIDFLYQKRKKTKNCTREENQFGIVISQDEQREP